MFDVIIAGAGIAGAAAARVLAEKGNKKVLVIEKRDHIGGNCYDTEDEHGVLIHPYGPHIFHTSDEGVYSWLSRFTEWYHYGHEVAASVHGQLIPVPFNLNTLYIVYEESKAEELEQKLVESYGRETKVPILELREHKDPDIRGIATYVYENIYLNYTMKQWGKKPEELDPAVTARVPVFISRDNRYFQDQYQGVPKDGYTNMFRKMLTHPGIEVHTGKDVRSYISFKDNRIWYDGKPFAGKLIYTGALDELFDNCCGDLPYRSLDFVFEHYDQDSWQNHNVVNYTVDQDYTRISEYKKLTGQKISGTTISKEYPVAYTGRSEQIPYYPIAGTESAACYQMYAEKAEKIRGLHLLGRLAEYKYYNIDSMVSNALKFADQMLEEECR